MPHSLVGVPKELQKVVGRIGHAVSALPDKYRDPIIDKILVALAAAQADRDTTAYERDKLPKVRERMLSAIADSPLRVQLEHDDELVAVMEKVEVNRTKSREDLFLKRHKKAHMAEAERKYVPPAKGP